MDKISSSQACNLIKGLFSCGGKAGEVSSSQAYISLAGPQQNNNNELLRMSLPGPPKLSYARRNNFWVSKASQLPYSVFAPYVLPNFSLYENVGHGGNIHSSLSRHLYKTLSTPERPCSEWLLKPQETGIDPLGGMG